MIGSNSKIIKHSASEYIILNELNYREKKIKETKHYKDNEKMYNALFNSYRNISNKEQIETIERAMLSLMANLQKRKSELQMKNRDEYNLVLNRFEPALKEYFNLIIRYMNSKVSDYKTHLVFK